MSEVHFIITGGTIDSVEGKAHPNQKSVIAEYIANATASDNRYSFETLCMLDSSDITDEWREKIYDSILNAEAQKIIVTHGTNTMTETLEYLQNRLLDSDKIVILTGAITPLKESVFSDSGFNLGYSVGQVEALEAGIYLCMQGKTFTAGKVRKNFELKKFEEI